MSDEIRTFAEDEPQRGAGAYFQFKRAYTGVALCAALSDQNAVLIVGNTEEAAIEAYRRLAGEDPALSPNKVVKVLVTSLEVGNAH